MNNELFTVKPSLNQYYGRTVTKDMEFDESTDNGEIHQTLKDCVLTTEISREWTEGSIKNTLKSVQTETLQRELSSSGANYRAISSLMYLCTN